MPPQPRHNWPHLYEVYLKVCEERPNTSYSEFARQHGADEGACRAAFNRLKKNRAKLTFQTERTVRTDRTDRPESGRTVRRSTGIMDGVSEEDVGAVVKQISSPGLIELQTRIMTMLFRSIDRIDAVQQMQCALNEDGTPKIRVESGRDAKEEYMAQKELIFVAQLVMPFISELRDRAGIEDVIENLLSRKYDITQAALEITKLGANLPEALKVMLAKVPPVLIANNFDMPDLDELDQRALETLRQVQWQYECFLPERRQEVIEMKKELKGAESFGPDKEDPGKEEPGES